VKATAKAAVRAVVTVASSTGAGCRAQRYIQGDIAARRKVGALI
jgi:hypothetical protein